MNPNDIQYFNQTLRRAVYLESLKQHSANQFGDTLKAVDDYLATHVFNLDFENMTVGEVIKLSKQIEKDLSEMLNGFGLDLTEALSDIFVDSYKFEAKSIAKAYALDAAVLTPVTASSLASSAVKVVAVVPITLSKDSNLLLDDLLSNFSQMEAKKVANACTQAHFEGKTLQQLVQQIRGTRAGGFNDGILSTTTRNAQMIARTAVAQTACQARQQFADDNEELFEGVQLIATLDGRTTSQCRSLDGMVLDKDDKRRPPFHIGCRTSFMFVLKPEYRIVEGSKKRASINGKVDNQSYYEWLKSQPRDFQDDVLGAVRAKLFREGGLSAVEFAKLNIDKNFQPLTLEEMRKREPLAFEKAGI